MAKVILGKGQHIVPQLWESAQCANISLKRAYKEMFAMASLKTIGLAEPDENNFRPPVCPRLREPRPRLGEHCCVVAVEVREGPLALCTPRWLALAPKCGSLPTPSRPKCTGNSGQLQAGRDGQWAVAVGGLRAATQECRGLAHILNLPYGPASWDPGW